MKKGDWIKVGAFVGVAAVVGIAGHYWLKKQDESLKVSSEVLEDLLKPIKPVEMKVPNTTADLQPVEKKTVSKFPIQIGDQGEHITQVQAHLLKHHGWAEVNMGIYDSITAARVKRFWKVDQITKSVYQKHIKNPIKLK